MRLELGLGGSLGWLGLECIISMKVTTKIEIQESVRVYLCVFSDMSVALFQLHMQSKRC